MFNRSRILFSSASNTNGNVAAILSTAAVEGVMRFSGTGVGVGSGVGSGFGFGSGVGIGFWVWLWNWVGIRVGFDIIGQVPVAVAVAFQDILIGPKIDETAGIAQRKRSIPSPVFTSVIASSDCGLTPVS